MYLICIYIFIYYMYLIYMYILYVYTICKYLSVSATTLPSRSAVSARRVSTAFDCKRFLCLLGNQNELFHLTLIVL